MHRLVAGVDHPQPAVPELRRLAVGEREVADPDGAVRDAADRGSAQLEHDLALAALDGERPVGACGSGKHGRRRKDAGRCEKEKRTAHCAAKYPPSGCVGHKRVVRIRKARHNRIMRRLLSALPLLAALVAPGSAPASGSPPRLLGLGVSNGGHPFAGDSRELATVSPNGDRLRDHAYFRFRLNRPAIVETQVVATDEVRRPAKDRLERAAAPEGRASRRRVAAEARDRGADVSWPASWSGAFTAASASTGSSRRAQAA